MQKKLKSKASGKKRAKRPAAKKKPHGETAKTNGVPASTQSERIAEFTSPEFAQRLLDHMNKAVRNALKDGKE
jgi:hypothetical protein